MQKKHRSTSTHNTSEGHALPEVSHVPSDFRFAIVRRKVSVSNPIIRVRGSSLALISRVWSKRRPWSIHCHCCRCTNHATTQHSRDIYRCKHSRAYSVNTKTRILISVKIWKDVCYGAVFDLLQRRSPQKARASCTGVAPWTNCKADSLPLRRPSQHLHTILRCKVAPEHGSSR